jgi:hypothetical protein
VLRRAAEWLAWAAAAGASVIPDSRVRAFLALLEATAWIIRYLPEIQSYLDGPKAFDELQDAVADPQAGYEIHHIVETQYRSQHPLRNSKRFIDRLETRENLVRIPRWKHVQISSWYSRLNEDYRGMSPRAYLRGKSWPEQYEIGLRALRLYGVLK